MGRGDIVVAKESSFLYTVKFYKRFHLYQCSAFMFTDIYVYTLLYYKFPK